MSVGPSPDRVASYPYGPGGYTGLVLFPSSAGGGPDLYSNNPMGVLVTAKLGSMGVGEWSTLISWYDINARFEMYAERISTTQVRLGVTHRSGIQSYGVVTVPWNGPDALYTWVFTNRVASSTGTIIGVAGCGTPIAASFNGAGSTDNVVNNLRGDVAEVPSDGPSDKVLLRAEVWWNPTSPKAPTTAEFMERMPLFACPPALVENEPLELKQPPLLTGNTLNFKPLGQEVSVVPYVDMDGPYSTYSYHADAQCFDDEYAIAGNLEWDQNYEDPYGFNYDPILTLSVVSKSGEVGPKCRLDLDATIKPTEANRWSICTVSSTHAVVSYCSWNPSGVGDSARGVNIALLRRDGLNLTQVDTFHQTHAPAYYYADCYESEVRRAPGSNVFYVCSSGIYDYAGKVVGDDLTINVITHPLMPGAEDITYYNPRIEFVDNDGGFICHFMSESADYFSLMGGRVNLSTLDVEYSDNVYEFPDPEYTRELYGSDVRMASHMNSTAWMLYAMDVAVNKVRVLPVTLNPDLTLSWGQPTVVKTSTGNPLTPMGMGILPLDDDKLVITFCTYVTFPAHAYNYLAQEVVVVNIADMDLSLKEDRHFPIEIQGTYLYYMGAQDIGIDMWPGTSQMLFANSGGPYLYSTQNNDFLAVVYDYNFDIEQVDYVTGNGVHDGLHIFTFDVLTKSGFVSKFSGVSNSLFSGSMSQIGNVDGPVLTARFADLQEITNMTDGSQRKMINESWNRWYMIDSDKIKMIHPCEEDFVVTDPVPTIPFTNNCPTLIGTVPQKAQHIALSPYGDKLYYSSYEDIFVAPLNDLSNATLVYDNLEILDELYGMTVDDAGNIYIMSYNYDETVEHVVKFDKDYNRTVLATTRSSSVSGYGSQIAWSPYDGNLYVRSTYIDDYGLESTLMKVSPITGIVTTLFEITNYGFTTNAGPYIIPTKDGGIWWIEFGSNYEEGERTYRWDIPTSTIDVRYVDYDTDLYNYWWGLVPNLDTPTAFTLLGDHPITLKTVYDSNLNATEFGCPLPTQTVMSAGYTSSMQASVFMTLESVNPKKIYHYGTSYLFSEPVFSGYRINAEEFYITEPSTWTFSVLFDESTIQHGPGRVVTAMDDNDPLPEIESTIFLIGPGEYSGATYEGIYATPHSGNTSLIMLYKVNGLGEAELITMNESFTVATLGSFTIPDDGLDYYIITGWTVTVAPNTLLPTSQLTITWA